MEHHHPRWAVLQPLISLFPVPFGLAVMTFATRRFIDGDWMRNGVLLRFRVSVAATLAPSGEDWRSSFLGTVLAVTAVLLPGQFHPNWWIGLQPPAAALLPHVAQVVEMPAVIRVALRRLNGRGRGRR